MNNRHSDHLLMVLGEALNSPRAEREVRKEKGSLS
jgi:hypothetical protein